MSQYVNDYKNAFNSKSIIGVRKWIFFTFKSAVLLLVLILLFSLVQYWVIMYSPLADYMTVPGIEQSNIYGMIFMLAASFGPSGLYLVRIIMRSR